MVARYILTAVAFLLVFGACKKESVDPTQYDADLLKAVNEYRMGIGLSALEHNEFLWGLAQQHSKYMAENETNSNHDGITERYSMIREELGNGEAKENVAFGSGSAQEVVNEWLKSVGLKANIEGDFNLTGLSAIRAENGTWYYTQIFFK